MSSVREAVIEYTTNLFISQGVRSVRMDDIASGMSMSKRTIYEIFGDKETLITECVNEFFARKERLSRQTVEGAQNVIEEFLMMTDNAESDSMMQGNMNFMNEIKKFYPVIYDKVVKEHNVKMREDLKEKFLQGIEEGVFLEGLNIDLAVYLLNDSIFSVLARSEADQAGMIANLNVYQAIRYVIVLFIRGFSTEKGRKIIDDHMDENISILKQ